MLCPCGLKKAYLDCCGRYISGENIPGTAETLMRSRYTAYTLANIDYIQKTMREQAAEGYDPIAAKGWATSARFKRLKVVRTFPDPTDPEQYYVQFKVHYIFKGRAQQLEEISQFKRIEGHWFYVGCLEEL